ncbi:hypothetical protein J6500_00620 [Bradyrhizobium sp. WSM 1704]|uniref:hypothetical protein n=1 Tax=Bradyrhizobium semiaridum TaxID=2821404 RepID=UPI001CE34CAB|nr:hypothetical protein [Bradyrhizobium semiaridum]MCA6120410.1 hypothetical protein [Bradyrhizobium semiaridum]
MTHIIFSDFREPAASEAYEIAYDYLLRTGAIRDEFEICVFLAQHLAAMVEQGQTNKIRMANRAIGEYERYISECETLNGQGICGYENA